MIESGVEICGGWCERHPHYIWDYCYRNGNGESACSHTAQMLLPEFGAPRVVRRFRVFVTPSPTGKHEVLEGLSEWGFRTKRVGLDLPNGRYNVRVEWERE